MKINTFDIDKLPPTTNIVHLAVVLKMNLIAINKHNSKLKIGALKCQTHHIKTVRFQMSANILNDTKK